jgi:putative ABC transport system permease protein
MAIPISYNLRNLVVRKTTTLMTALGIALTVAVLLAVLALANGLKKTLGNSGDPLQVVVVRKGANSELVSNFTHEAFQDLRFKPGIARDASGEPLASLELVTVINLESVDAPSGMNVNVRGLLPVGIKMRPRIRIERGRWFSTGRHEVVVGKSIADRFPDARLGKRLTFAGGVWDVVGIMEAGRSASDSEIFADLSQLATGLHRPEVLSSALVRATDPVTAAALINDISADRRLNVTAESEPEYYAQAAQSAAPIEYLGGFVAVIMGIGSSFAAMNTMYAAVARRAREIGTLRVLGFSRPSILFSFFIESVLLSILGGLLGCLLVMPLNGLTTAVGANFSELAFDFRVSPQIMLTGIAFAVILGVLGGLFPARSAARKEILTALREL